MPLMTSLPPHQLPTGHAARAGGAVQRIVQYVLFAALALNRFPGAALRLLVRFPRTQEQRPPAERRRRLRFDLLLLPGGRDKSGG